MNNQGVSLLGVAGSAGSYSSQASVGDMILRCNTGKNLILQDGTANSVLYINGGKFWDRISNCFI